MRVLRASSLEEYASWYVRRNARKHDSSPIPSVQEQPVAQMLLHHGPKMRDWFNAHTTWHIVDFEEVSDLADLVFLESHWTKQEGLVVRDGLNYRLLDRVAKNAMESRYLSRTSDDRHRHYV
jgi:hypothetical protein